MSTSAAAPALESVNTGFHWGQALLQVATRRRIALTTLVIALLFTGDIVVWHTRPGDLFNWTDVATVVGELLLAGGLLLRAWAAGTLCKRERIITCGPYQFVRNPLYVGSFLMMLGFSLLVRDWLTIWIVLGPVPLLYLNKIRQEEKYLARFFPEDWSAYARATPRLIPEFRRWPSLTGFSFRQWARNHEYQALLASVAGLIVLWCWQRAMT